MRAPGIGGSALHRRDVPREQRCSRGGRDLARSLAVPEGKPDVAEGLLDRDALG